MGFAMQFGSGTTRPITDALSFPLFFCKPQLLPHFFECFLFSQQIFLAQGCAGPGAVLSFWYHRMPNLDVYPSFNSSLLISCATAASPSIVGHRVLTLKNGEPASNLLPVPCSVELDETCHPSADRMLPSPRTRSREGGNWRRYTAALSDACMRSILSSH